MEQQPAQAVPAEPGKTAPAGTPPEAAKEAAIPVPTPAPRPYVLAVDESRLQLRSYEQAFNGTKELKRFDMVACGAPRAVVEKLSQLRAREPKPAVILLEWRKPYAASVELLETLRRDVRWAKIPVILVAASAVDGADAERHLRFGPMESILKPIKLNLLAEKVNRLAPSI